MKTVLPPAATTASPCCRCADNALMQFGFRFLRQVLFGEESIPLRQEAAEQHRLRHMERRQRMQTEAAARRAMEQDDMYKDPDE